MLKNYHITDKTLKFKINQVLLKLLRRWTIQKLPAHLLLLIEVKNFMAPRRRFSLKYDIDFLISLIQYTDNDVFNF
jgi:hypothetical protein